MGKAKRPTLHRISFPEGLEIPESIDVFGRSSTEAFRMFLEGKVSKQGADARKLSPGMHVLGPNGSGSERELKVITAVLARYNHVASRARVPFFGMEVEVSRGEPVEIPRDADGLAVVAETRNGGVGVFDLVLPKVYKVPEAPPIPQNLAVVV